MSDQFTVGNIKTIIIPAPAQGANFSYTIPVGRRMHVRSIAFHFVTDANVATRRVVVYVIDPEGGISYSTIPTVTQAAGLSYDYTFAPGSRELANAVGRYVTSHLASKLILVPGENISSDIQNVQAGDQIQEIYLLVEEFILP